MSNMTADIQIDEMHCEAIRQEIGERLRIELRGNAPMPLSLVRLIARLPELDHHDSPSIVPSLDDADRAVEEFEFADAN
jgi:hypothetical protein